MEEEEEGVEAEVEAEWCRAEVRPFTAEDTDAGNSEAGRAEAEAEAEAEAGAGAGATEREGVSGVLWWCWGVAPPNSRCCKLRGDCTGE